MNSWTGALFHSPHFFPSSLTPRVANCLPVESLVSIRVQAVSRATEAHSVHGWRLTAHTHRVALSEVLHPPCQGAVFQGAVMRQGLCLELHTVSGILCVCRPLWGGCSSGSLLVERRGGYKGRDKGVPAVLALGCRILQAAGSLLQGRAGRAAVLGLLAHRAPPHSRRRLALVRTSAPGAPLPNDARASWARPGVVEAAVSGEAAGLVAETRPIDPVQPPAAGEAGGVPAGAAAPRVSAAAQSPGPQPR